MKNLLLLLVLTCLFISCKESQGVSDSIPPVVEILTPSENQVIDINFQLEYLITEENLDSASIYLGNTFLLGISEPSATVDLDASDIIDGEYVLRLIAFDLFGNNSSDEVTVSLNRPDTDKPIVSILEPQEEQIVDEYFDLIYSIDETALDSISVYLDQTFLASTSDPSSRITLNATGLEDGTYTVIVRAVDLEGNTASDSVNISLIRDALVAPLVNILEPRENQKVGEFFDLIYNSEDSDLEVISVYIDQTLLTRTNQASSRVTLNTTNLDEGTYSLKVEAIDLKGNIGSDSVTILFDRPDTQAPVVTIVSPDFGEVFYDTIGVEIEASDNEGISKVQLFFNEALQGELEEPPYNFDVDIQAYRNGNYPLKAVAIDLEGNTDTETRYVDVITEPVLEKPIEFSATKGESWNSIQLDWVSVPVAQRYEVYRLHPVSQEFQLIGIANSNQYIDRFDDLEFPKTNIFYKVRAFNSNIEFGEFSDLDYGFYTGRTYEVILSFNTRDIGSSEHITVDDDGNFYISETSSNSIGKFSSDGSFVETYFSCGTPRGLEIISSSEAIVACSSENKIKVIDNEKNIIREWGGTGTGNGQFIYFRQIALDDSTVFIVDHSNHRVQKMDLEGNFILKWGSEGFSDGSFDYPWGIVVFKDMVVVGSDKRIQFFNKDGSFIKTWRFESSLQEIAADENYIYVGVGGAVLKIDEDRNIIDRIGDGDGGTNGVAVLNNGDVVVLDTSDDKVRVYRENE